MCCTTGAWRKPDLLENITLVYGFDEDASSTTYTSISQENLVKDLERAGYDSVRDVKTGAVLLPVETAFESNSEYIVSSIRDPQAAKVLSSGPTRTDCLLGL